VPLLLGSGVDYTLHVQLALRRVGPAGWWRSTGVAIVLCAVTTIAGFGSLGFSGNAGLASLGSVCAAGVACSLATSLGLLPVWWKHLASSSPAPTPNPSQPSLLYGRAAWKLGRALGRIVPRSGLRIAGAASATVYRWIRPDCAEIVRQNLEPLAADPTAAGAAVCENFAAFGRKLADLWAYEAGVSMDRWIRPGSGMPHLRAATGSGRGVLLVTLHLGNWEFGAPLISKMGTRLIVLTADEPGGGFTELRQQGRARQGIETLVVGRDPFSFVPVIRCLQEGACVALLIDRPAAETAVDVTFFGRPFRASGAAADLARATGCEVLPVAVIEDGGTYRADVLPAVPYERRGLAQPDARRAFTGQILRAFEPLLREHPDQWFHFVPVWPKAGDGSQRPDVTRHN
jgi:lauroyl/myristoyl acyltransferase